MLVPDSQNQLKILENGTFQTDKLFRLEQRKKVLENQLEVLNSQAQIKTNLFGNITTRVIKLENALIITLGLFL